MATKRKKPAKKTGSDSVYQLRITLFEANPSIWRQLLVPADVTLGDLNYILQAAMGWTNSHLHQFTIHEVDYSDPRFELDDVEDEFGVALSDVAPRAGTRFVFLYDFGDGWEHEVTVEKVLQREPEKHYPVCVAGKRAGPPEDCGGVWGYAEFLEAIRDPKHEEHDEMLEWIDGEFDPDAFDVNELNQHLIQYAKMFASWQ